MNFDNNTQEQENKDMNTVCIVGAGLVGSLLSTYLARRGFNVEVYEKRTDPRVDIKQRGRSIVMSISPRGWKALRYVGLEDRVGKTTLPKYSRMVHMEDGSTLVQNYGNGSQAIHTINRKYLNTTLIEESEKTGRIKFFFNHRCVDINPGSLNVKFIQSIENKEVEKNFSKVIGADGIFSKVRQILVEKELWNFDKNVLGYGYKELTIHAINGE